MRLHLVRHAKTDPSSDTGRDFDRKLLPKGIIQSNSLAHHLIYQKIEPEIVYCSDATRTKETASILAQAVPLKKITYNSELYLADRETLLQLIWGLKHGKELMIIGHNDGLSDLATYLTDELVHMKTCGYLCIEFPFELWRETSRGTGKIIDSFRPSVFLPAL